MGRLVGGTGNSSQSLATASSLTTPENSLYSPRILSSDGRRLFFNSFDALLPRDTNGKGDVYEWESALSPGECEEKGAELYVASARGCLSLISTGESPQDSEFLDASANGNDAFFTTNASLLPQDPGLVDVYDARVGGGLPTPPGLPAACEGEACQGPITPPNDPTPASAAFNGPGNLKEEPKVRCAKGKARRKGRCVKKHKSAKHHKASKQKRANRNRRTAR